MNKFVLPSTAALLILVIAVSSFMPAAAVARVVVAPYLQVVTIPEDDQIRQTGFMLLGLSSTTGLPAANVPTDFLSQHKLLITLNGLLVPSSGLVVMCNVIEKDKEALPPDESTGKFPSKNRQFTRENMKTALIDVAQYFICKAKYKAGMSVGVLDVYYIGPQDKAFIADHILVVHVTYTVGRQVFYGTEIQDICMLGWPVAGTYTSVTKYYLNAKGVATAGDQHWLQGNFDPMGAFPGCEDAALYERSLINELPLGQT